MPSLNIKLIRRGGNYMDAFPEINAVAQLYGAAVIEAGVTSGQSAVGFVIKTEDEGVLVCETSSKLIEGLYAGIRGAEMRWGTPQDKSNPFLELLRAANNLAIAIRDCKHSGTGIPHEQLLALNNALAPFRQGDRTWI